MTVKKLLFICLCLSLWIHSASYSFAQTPIIIDTDMGSDDWMAILYLLKKPEADIKGIIVDGNGIAHQKAGVQNLLGLLALSDKTHIPIAMGATRSLTGKMAYPDNIRHDADAMCDIILPDDPHPKVSKDGQAFLVTLLKNATQPVTILAIGPLTNIAMLVDKHPDLKPKIKRIFVMGGAIHVAGNIQSIAPKSPNKVAEWNFYIDPQAAQTVFKSGIPLTLVSLDITNQLPITLKFYHSLQKIHKTPESKFVCLTLAKQAEWIKKSDYYFWDPLAAVLMMNPLLYSGSSIPLTISTKPGLMWAKVNEDKKGNMITVVTKVEAKQFEQEFLQTLNGGEKYAY